MHWVYIIESIKYKRFYIGSTANLNDRILRHNKGGSVWTSRYKPWKLIYSEKFETKNSALAREREIKSWKGGNTFKNLIENNC